MRWYFSQIYNLDGALNALKTPQYVGKQVPQVANSIKTLQLYTICTTTECILTLSNFLSLFNSLTGINPVFCLPINMVKKKRMKKKGNIDAKIRPEQGTFQHFPVFL